MNDKQNGAAVSGRPKSLAEAQQWMKAKLAARAHPMNSLDQDEGAALIDTLTGLDGDSWTSVWRPAADAVMAQAVEAEREGDNAVAVTLFQKAAGLYFMGRFPCPNHPAKQECADLERAAYLAQSRFWESPIERVEIPFDGNPGEGDRIVFYVRSPAGAKRPPVVLTWGGVDAWKEQMRAASDALLAEGIAVISMDNAGTGESPVRGSFDAERVFIAVLDWAAQQDNLAGQKCALLGRSFGGYWVTKLCHIIPERLICGVNWGGGAHYMFQPEWVEASRYPDSYLMELVETRMRMLGARNDEEYINLFKSLSLLDQGLLDRSCAPLLLVNGKDDQQCPYADIELLIEKGSPKSIRLFPGGHMGNTPQTLPTVVQWITDQLARSKA